MKPCECGSGMHYALIQDEPSAVMPTRTHTLFKCGKFVEPSFYQTRERRAVGILGSPIEQPGQCAFASCI